MRSTVAALAIPLLVLAGCGGRSAGEEAYLAELQERSSFVELPDPDGALEDGEMVCEILGDTKPEERYTAAGVMISGGYGISFPTVSAAVTHLCPDLKGALDYPR